MKKLLVPTALLVVLCAGSCGRGAGIAHKTSEPKHSRTTPPAKEPTPPAKQPTPPAKEPTPRAKEPTPPAARCSAGQPCVKFVDQDLPSAVATTRRQIFEAATACNGKRLVALTASDFVHTNHFEQKNFTQDELAASWKTRHCETLTKLLAMRPAASGKSYVWPAVAAENTDEAWTEAMRQLGITESDRLGQVELGGFTGPRTIIDSDGDWSSFTWGE